MKKITHPILTILVGFITLSVSGQIIKTEPFFPTADQAVSITFNATLGDAGLADFEGDVYAHTGVLTDKSSSSSNWRYVIAEWNENTEKAKLTRIGKNLYQLKIEPSIRAFYGVPEGEKITDLAFVFRNSDGSKQGKETESADIFVNVVEPGLNVTIFKPYANPTLVEKNDELEIEAHSINATNLSLFIDGKLKKETSTNDIYETLTVAELGLHKIKVIATDGNKTAADSVEYFVKGQTSVAELPDGLVNGINYIDDNSLTLVLYAPHKEFVYVMGDFNDWKLDNHFMMNKTPDGKHFWIKINNLEKGKEYIYQYFIDGVLRIADPYAEKLSDPWNDKYISETSYPNLIAYPEGKTTGIASVFQTAQTPYDWEITNFVAPEKENLVIYELHIRDWSDLSNINTVLDSIGYFQELGINAIELMPINEFEGNDSWGYNPSFYFAADKYYGTKNDYKKFIDVCHKHGIAVIIDMVLNHSFGQSPFVQMYFEGNAPSAENPWYNSSCPHSDWCWGNDFDHESKVTQKLIDRINAYWLQEYNVDGFRFDFTKGFTNKTDPAAWKYDQSRVDILTRMSDKIWEVNPNAYVILEHLTENKEEKALADYGMLIWGNMNRAYSNAAMGYGEASNFDWASYKFRGWNKANLISYMESHDEERMMYQLLNHGNSLGSYSTRDFAVALQRVELAAAFFFTIPGPKMIWQFGELGYDYSIDYNERVGRKPIKWEYFNNPNRKRLYQVFSALIKLKTQNEAFKSTDFTTNLKREMRRIVIKDEQMDVVVLGNFGMFEGAIEPKFTTTGKWYDFFSGEEIEITDADMYIVLEAGEYRIYTTKQLEKPNILEIGNPELSISVENFTSEDEIILNLDMNKVKDFSADEDLYLWVEQPEFDKNGKWENSDESMKMTNNGDGTYSFSISPNLAQFFNVDPNLLRTFVFLFKTKDGSWHSDSFIRKPYFEFSDPQITFSPEGVNADKEVVMTVNLSKTDYPGGEVYLWLWDPAPPSENGEWSDSNEALKLTNEGKGIYTFTFSPSIAEYYGLPASELHSFSFLIKTDDGSWKTADYKQKVGSPVAIEDISSESRLKVYPNPISSDLNLVHTDNINRVQIYDTTGKLLEDRALHTGKNRINMQEYKSGLYVLKFYATKRFVGSYKLIRK